MKSRIWLIIALIFQIATAQFVPVFNLTCIVNGSDPLSASGIYYMDRTRLINSDPIFINPLKSMYIFRSLSNVLTLSSYKYLDGMAGQYGDFGGY